jgi:hypothetical protein
LLLAFSENEKKRVSDMKDRIERDLLEEKRTREEFEVNLLKLRDSVLQKEGVISGLQLEFNNLVNENSLSRRDLEAVKFDLSSLQVHLELKYLVFLLNFASILH